MSRTGSTERPRLRAGSPWTSRLALTAVFVALAVAMGLVLISVPNVELLTFTVFAAGSVLGRWRGVVVGALAAAIYSGMNPYGSGLALPPLYAAQIAAMAFTGLAGGTVAGLWRPDRRRPGRAALVLIAGGVGFFLTVVYQVAVVLGLVAAMPDLATGVVAALLANAPFAVVHVVSNAVLFAVLAPVVLPRLGRLAARTVVDGGASVAVDPPARAQEEE